MENIIDYAKKNFKSFARDPFNDVDSVILSWISYLCLECVPALKRRQIGATFRDLFHAELFEKLMQNSLYPELGIELLTAVTASPRFRNIRLFAFESDFDANFDNSTQFAALTYKINPNLCYIAYRGTDCTFIGWKEDFEMALSESTPSQELAADYLSRMAARFQGKLLIGGHSKGGNHAVYAAAHAAPDIQARIQAVYSHDGPGLKSNETQLPGFLAIKDRIHKTIPQSSLIGMIFDQECECSIVKSDQISVYQHNPFSWEVEGSSFVSKDKLTGDARRFNIKLNNWLAQLEEEDRRKFIDGIFSVLEQTNVVSFSDLRSNLKGNIPAIIRTLSDMDPEMQKFLFHTLKLLLKSASKEESDEDTVE